MVGMRLVFTLLLCLGPLFAEGIPREEYQKRRADLRKGLNGVMVLFGATESEDLHFGFFQETNFLYLSGWREPGAVMVLTPKEEILFLPPRNPRQEAYTGRKLGPEDADAAEKTGFAKVMPKGALQGALLRILESAPRVYTLPNEPQAQKIKALTVFHEEGDAAREIARLRMVKSAAEIALIQNASDATVAAHLAAWKAMRPGLYEYEIASVMSNVYFSRGCERHAYAPI